MSSSSEIEPPSREARAGWFATTHWSIVLSAGRHSTSRSERALGALCEAYWQPLYIYARRKGSGREDAEDLIQGFFARLIERGNLSQVRRERGKFRSFLLASLKHYLANEWDRAQAQKRGGGRQHVPLDEELLESGYRGLRDELTPDLRVANTPVDVTRFDLINNIEAAV